MSITPLLLHTSSKMSAQDLEKGNNEIILNIKLLQEAVDCVIYMVCTALAINFVMGIIIFTLLYLNYLIKKKIDHLNLQAKHNTDIMDHFSDERSVRKHCDECNVMVKGPDPRKRFKCDVCRIETACQVSLNDHKTGKEHIMQMKQWREKMELLNLLLRLKQLRKMVMSTCSNSEKAQSSMRHL